MSYFKQSGMEKEIDQFVEVESNYCVKKILGFGATSVVYKALDTSDESKTKTVAIKSIQNIFESDIYAHRLLREMKLMRILRGHQNIVKLKNIMRPTDPENFNSLNFVMEYCS